MSVLRAGRQNDQLAFGRTSYVPEFPVRGGTYPVCVVRNWVITRIRGSAMQEADAS